MSSGDEIEMETETSRKRKGGSIGDSPPSLKRQNSCPNIKESSLASAVFEAKYVNVGDIIVKSFQDTKSKKISNDQELIQSDPISCPQNQKGNN